MGDALDVANDKPRRVLITGACGFVGTHLASALLSKGQQLFGFDQPDSRLRPELAPSVQLCCGDICDETALARVLAEVKPEVVYHLAAILKSARIDAYYSVNVLGTAALLRAIAGSGSTPRILVASSSAVYGKGLGARPITEQFKLRPVTPYAVSKVVQEAVAYHYFRAYRLPVIRTRTFNLLGPGQAPSMAIPAFAQQIARAEQAGDVGTIGTGNLSARRDFVDIRDAVRAYVMLAEDGNPGQVYNVCSQKAVSIQQCLNILLAQARVPLRAIVDPARLQANDVPVQLGSVARLAAQTQWRPQFSLRQSLLDVLNYWREQVTSEQRGKTNELAG